MNKMHNTKRSGGKRGAYGLSRFFTNVITMELSCNLKKVIFMISKEKKFNYFEISSKSVAELGLYYSVCYMFTSLLDLPRL